MLIGFDSRSPSEEPLLPRRGARHGEDETVFRRWPSLCCCPHSSFSIHSVHALKLLCVLGARLSFERMRVCFSVLSSSFPSTSVNSRLALPVSTDTKSVRDKPVWLRFLVVSVPCAAAACMLQLRISSCTPAFGSASGWCLCHWPAPPGFCLGALFAGVWALLWCAGAVSGLGLHRQGPAAG